MLKRLTSRVRRALARLAGDNQPLPLERFPSAPDLFFQYRQFAAHPALKRQPGGWDYQGRFYPDYLTMGGASHAIFRVALQYCRGCGLDVGAGLWPLPSATPVDIWRGLGATRLLAEIPEGTQDFLFSSHCLEHVAAWQAELDRWVGKVKPGGMIFLYLPHPQCGIWNPGSPMVGDGHQWQPDPAVVKEALRLRGCEVVAFDDGPDAMMSFFVCAQRRAV